MLVAFCMLLCRGVHAIRGAAAPVAGCGLVAALVWNSRVSGATQFQVLLQNVEPVAGRPALGPVLVAIIAL